MSEKSFLYQGKNCPCPADCVRHGKCKECIRFHRNRGEATYCEQISEKLEPSWASALEANPPTGREIQLLDYANCAG